LVKGTVDPAIQDIQNKNYSGLAGDVAGGAVKAVPLVLSGGSSAAAEGAEAAEGADASVNLIWPLLIFSFGPTPLVIHHSAPGRSEALRRPEGDAFRAQRRPGAE
ncbi:MAG: hypothetical protein WCE52_08355, partial [Candidatus Acidiferrum sp.]